jgi:hypothetical protein
MNTNRYETAKPPKVKRHNSSSAGPAWWGLAIGAAFAFVVAITWLLQRSA